MRPSRHALVCFLIAAGIFCASAVSARAEGNYEVKTLRSRNNGADYIVVAPKEFLKELQPLLDKRAADGLRVAVVTPPQIYGEFYRLTAGPKAIRAFVQYAWHNWKQPAPKYLLLVGDINVTDDYDPKGAAMPTFLLRSWQDPRDKAEGIPPDIAASDAPFGDVDNDEAPEIAVGRIPSDNPGELAAIVKKIVDYETNPAPGPWRRRASAFASTGNFGAFDKALEEITKKIIRNNFDPIFDLNMTYGSPALPYFLLPDEFGPKIIERFNEGALIVSYIGHGSVTGLSDVCYGRVCRDILESGDVSKIGAGGKESFFFSICCLTGKFNRERECLAEDLIKNPDGPVGVFAASQISSPYSNSLISKDLLYFLISKRPATIGEGLLNIKRALIQRFDDDRKYIDKQYGMVFGKDAMKEDSSSHVYMYNYFGDPATRIPYAAETTKIDAPAKADAGGTIQIAVSTQSKSAGKLLVTLECDPTEVIYPIKSIDGLAGDELDRTVRSNYENANNKVAASVETRLGDGGEAAIELKVPDFIPSGTYFIKTYAWDGTPDSMGIVKIEITNTAPAPPPAVAEKKQEKKAPAAEETALDLAIRDAKEPAAPVKKAAKPEAHAPDEASFDLKTLPDSELKVRIESNPKDAPAAIELADRYFGARKYDEAEAALKKAIKADKTNPAPYLKLANAYMAAGDYGKAVEPLTDSLKDAGESADTYVLLADVYGRLGRKDDAEKAYSDAARIAGKDDPARMNIFRYYFYRDKTKAEKEGRAIVEGGTIPGWEYVVKDLASIAFANGAGDVRESLELMWKYFKLRNRKYPKAMAVASLGTIANAPWTDAARAGMYLKKALAISPDCAECMTYEWRKFAADDAIDRCGRAVRIDPKLAEGYACLASANFDKNNFIQSADFFDKARALDPKAPTQNEILALLKAKRRDRAIWIADSAGSFPDFVLSEPDDVETNVVIFKIRVYSAAGEYGLAEREFDRFTDKHTENVFVLNAMAEVFAMQKKYDRAVKLEKSARTADPYCGKCTFNYGKYSAEIGQYRDAEAAFKDLISISPRDADARAELGTVYLKLGDRANARRMFNEALDISSGNAAAQNGMLGLIDPSFFLD
jgi:tetratricopeptide (TPR) repeat protein